MKKTLSLVLALLMSLSCFSVFFASAESGGLADMLYTDESIAASSKALKNFVVTYPADFPTNGFRGTFEEVKESSWWKKVSLMGISLDFLYSDSTALNWSKLDVYEKDSTGALVRDNNGLPIMKITTEDISLAMTNINMYLQKVFYKTYGGLELYNVENAIKLANIIGKALHHSFVELNVENYRNYFGSEVPTANEFFRAVTMFSGLDDVLNQNWIPKGRAFCEPIVTILGGDYINFFNEYYSDGLVLGSKILEAAIKKILTVGPIDYFVDILDVYGISSYKAIYREPTLALFSQKIAASSAYITVEELDTFDGLLKLIFCDCNAEASEGCYAADGRNVNHFDVFDFPVERYTCTTSKDEKMIYLYYYLNICGKYKGNSKYFESLKNSVNNNYRLDIQDRIKLSALISGFFLGNFAETVDEVIVPLYKENISGAGDSIFERFRSAFMIFMKKIADYFDYLRKIFTGELDYGGGNSPFN